MTQTTDEEAFRTMAKLEEGVCVTAGSLDAAAFFRRVERQRATLEGRISPLANVLGLFLNLARRERSLSLEQLAIQVDLDPLELLLIEEGKRVPDPRIVSKLARALEVPPGKMMQLAGHVETLDKETATAALAFATSATSKPLEPDERNALHEFVKALAAGSVA